MAYVQSRGKRTIQQIAQSYRTDCMTWGSGSMKCMLKETRKSVDMPTMAILKEITKIKHEVIKIRTYTSKLLNSAHLV